MLGDFCPEFDASDLALNGNLIMQFKVADLLESHEESGASLTIRDDLYKSVKFPLECWR